MEGKKIREDATEKPWVLLGLMALTFPNCSRSVGGEEQDKWGPCVTGGSHSRRALDSFPRCSPRDFYSSGKSCLYSPWHMNNRFRQFSLRITSQNPCKPCLLWEADEFYTPTPTFCGVMPESWPAVSRKQWSLKESLRTYGSWNNGEWGVGEECYEKSRPCLQWRQKPVSKEDTQASARLTMSLVCRSSSRAKTIPDPLKGKKENTRTLNLTEWFPKRKQLGCKLRGW